MTAISEDEPGQAIGRRRRAILQGAVALGALTLVAAGSGTMVGLHLVESVKTALETRAEEVETPSAPTPRYAGGLSLYDLPPVITNLAAPADVWVRVESSIVIADAEIASPEILAGEIAADMLAYLRTISLARIEGPSGLLHLREDLNDRVAIRSEGKVRELIVETLVVQ